MAPKADPEVLARANEMLNERTGALEDQLSARDFLVGDHLTAADIACAAPLYLIDMKPEAVASSPTAAFFHEHLSLGEGREKTLAWVRRVLNYDPINSRR